MDIKSILTAGIIIKQGNKILLVRHTENSKHPTGMYGIPAGRIENNESIVEGAVRELKEETGLSVRVADLIRLPLVYVSDLERRDGKKSFSFIVYYTDIFEGNITSSKETIPEWIDISNTEKLNINSGQREIIKDYLKLR